MFFLSSILVASSCFVKDRVKPYVVLYPDRGKQVVRFNYHAPSASSVYVAGDFNNWTVPRYQDEEFKSSEERSHKMRRDGDYWVAEVPLTPGLHYYKYYVDMMYWRVDEASHEKTQTLSGDWKNIIIVK